MTETRRSEIRAAPGRRLIGPAMVYGREADVFLPDGERVRERFAAFAFSASLRRGAPVNLNLMHDPSLTVASTRGGNRGNLELRDHADRLEMIATLPSGDPYDAVLALVRDGSTAETSVEFMARHELRNGGRRTVTQADLHGIGIVDAGAYGDAGRVEARRRGYRVSARVVYDRLYDCGCAGPTCDQAVFEPGSFADLPDEVIAVANEYKAPLASLRRGGLRLEADDDGLSVDVTLPDPDESAAARAVVEAAAAVPIFARPFVDRDRSESVEDGRVRRYQRAALRAIIIARPTGTAAGTKPS